MLTRWLTQRRRQRRRAFALDGALVGVVTLEALSLLVQLLCGSMSERGAAIIFCVIAAIAAAVGTWWTMRRLRAQNSQRGLVESYRKVTPGDMNTLETAVQLEQQGTLRPFEAALLKDYQARFGADNFASLRQSPAFAVPRCRWRLLALALAVAAMALFPLGIQRQACFGMVGAPAIVVTNEISTAVPCHSDLPIQVELRRGDGPVFLELAEDVGGKVRYEMHGADRNWQLTIYDVTANFAFRARTSSSATPWRRVEVYTPPAPTAVAITTTPPPYTRRSSQSFTAFKDFEVVAGEKIKVECQLPPGVSWRLDNKAAFATSAVELLATESKTFTPEFQDSDGHHANGNSFVVTVNPDLPPALEVSAPQSDGKLRPAAKLPLELKVTDDYGVVDVALHYTVDSGTTQSKTWSAGGNVDFFLDENLDISLQAGQLIIGYYEATDNRQPTPNVSRSELFFVTVLPDEDQGDSQSASNSGGQQQVSLDDLLAESKRLLRDSFDWLQLPDPRRADQDGRQRRHDLNQDLHSLALAVQQRAVAIAGSMGVPLPQELQQFFNEISSVIQRSAVMVEGGNVAGSLPLQRRGLAMLTRLNHELLKNAQRQKGSSQSAASSESGAGQQDDAAAEQPNSGDRAQDLETLRRVRDELQKIQQEQHRLQDSLAGHNPSTDAQQQQLAERLRNAADAVSGVASASQARSAMRQGAAELQSAAVALRNQQRTTALTHGRRGSERIQRAMKELDDVIRSESRSQIRKFASDAANLARRQERLAANNRDANAREVQEKLNQDVTQLQEKIRSVAQGMSQEFPAAAAALSQAMTDKEQGALQRTLRQARNALLYGRQERAATSQRQAAEHLQQWSQRLATVSAAMPTLSASELRQALSELQRLAQEVQEQDEEGRAGMAKAVAQTLEQLAGDMRSEQLQNLAEQAAQNAGASQPPLEAVIGAAARELREALRQITQKEQRQQLLTPAAPPPEKYRPQVQEYFRRLGAEEE